MLPVREKPTGPRTPVARRGLSRSVALQGVRDVRYQYVGCSVRTEGDNITVRAELSLNNSYQVHARDRAPLPWFAKLRYLPEVRGEGFFCIAVEMSLFHV